MNRLLVCVLLAAFAEATLSSEIIVTTPNGKIQGTLQKTNGIPYLQFNGIPYAKPPVGKLRFVPPKPIQGWQGVWIANSSYTCIQVDHYDDPQEGKTRGTEDCLYLNIFVPGETIPTKSLDVIVHIHGGGFMFGSSHVYALPKHFMTKEVIVVTINYRVGILGFLSLEDKYLPGNLGMKDQVMALKWIQENIAHFGGNADSVTITGLSAGGASVHYHLLSPMSKGLFHKAISASGNVLDPWAIHEAARAKAKEVGMLVGCTYENSKQFVGCLKARPADQIVETTKQFRSWIFLPFSPFGLVVDNKAKTPFLPEQPYKLLKEGKVLDVPWIASITTGEGLYPVAQLAQRKEYFKELRDNWEMHLAPILHYELTVPKHKMAEVAQLIKKEYLGDSDVSKENYGQIIKMASDRLFNIGMEDSIRLHSNAISSPAYFYIYDYTPEDIWSLPELLFGYKEKYGVSHADDILIIFSDPGKGSKSDNQMTEFLVNVWVDFAKSGKPGVKDWKPLSKKTSDDIDYLFIGSPADIRMKKTKNLGNNKFWKSLPIIENERLFGKTDILKDEL